MCTARCRRPRRWTSLRDSTSITRSCSSTTSNSSSAADNLLDSGELLSRDEARVTNSMVGDGTVGHYVILRTRTCHCHIGLSPANHGNRGLRRDRRGSASDRWRGHTSPSLLLSPPRCSLSCESVCKRARGWGRGWGRGNSFRYWNLHVGVRRQRNARRLPVQHPPTNECTPLACSSIARYFLTGFIRETSVHL